MFDLYFAGSGSNKVLDYKLEKDVNSLFSQLNEKKSIQKFINSDCKGKLFIDSGAFSAHKSGSEVDVDEYIQYINENDEHFTIYAQLDKIPGTFGKPKTPEEILEAPELSWKNYLYMKDKVKSRDKLIPVFHQGEDFKHLVRMLEYTHEDGKHIPYIGISPANDSSVVNKEAFIKRCFDIIKASSNPNVKTHAFGMTSLDLLEKYPFTSADSTSYIMSAAYGGIMTEFGLVSVSSVSQSKPGNYASLPKEAKERLDEYVKSKGYSMEELKEDAELRKLFNIDYLTDWQKNYVFKGTSNIKPKRLF